MTDIDAHFARHSVTFDDVMSVLSSEPLAFRNVEGRGGTHVLIGPDSRGRILYISVRPSPDPSIWEPVTGWESRFARGLWRDERGRS